MQASLECLKWKVYPKSSSEIGSFLTPEKGRPGNCESRAKESDQTDPEVWQKKMKKSSGRTASLEGELHELCLTPSGGCSLSTLAYEGDKNTTKWKLKISLHGATTTETNFLLLPKVQWLKTGQGGLRVKTSHPQDVCYRKRGKVSRHVVQTIFGEATKLPHCHRQASFKHLVQENPNGKEHHKHNHGKHVKRVHRLRICVQRRISSTIVHKCKKPW